jgi:TonB family protein
MQPSSDSLLLNSVRVASPCPVSWDNMTGDERVRFCSLCSLHVYNLSEMSTREAAELIRNRAGKRSCVKFFRRADGTMLTQNCPRGLRVARDRCVHFWQRAVATIFWISASVSQVLAEDDAPIPHRIQSLRRIIVSPKVPPYVPHTNKTGESTSGGVDIDYGPYMRSLQQKIVSRWNPPEKITPTKLVVITFKVSQSGQLSDLKLTHSADDEASDLAAMAAVDRAFPFLHLPPGAGDAVDIQFTFKSRSIHTSLKIVEGVAENAGSSLSTMPEESGKGPLVLKGYINRE